MSIELSTQTYVAALVGSNNAANIVANSETNAEAGENQERFAQYLMALKGAKLSETQLQKLSETRADDERTRTLEQLDRKAKAENDHYHKMRSNGYTVGETRRGLDQIDKAVERKTAETNHCATGEESASDTAIADATMSFGSTKGDGIGHTEMTMFGTTPGTLPGVVDMVVAVNGGHLADQTTQNVPANISTSDNATQIAQQVNGGNAAANGSQNNGNNAEKPVDIKQTDMVAEQSRSQMAARSGKTIAAAMAGVVSAMTSVSKNANTKFDAEFDAKISANIGQNTEQQERSQNTLTQEAVTAASETQQTANELRQPLQQMPMQQTASDTTAASQTLPNTSLLERVDQAKLTNRVASAFRSLANQSGTIRMKLHPEALGALTIRMQIEDGKVTAKLEAETETAKQVLLENVDSLKRKLKEQNLEVSAFDVEVVANEASQGDKAVQSKTNHRNNSQAEIVVAGRNNKGGTTVPRQNVGHVDYYS